MSAKGRIKASVCGLSFTGDVRVGVEVYEFLRRTPTQAMPPVIQAFYIQMHEELHRVYLEAHAGSAAKAATGVATDAAERREALGRRPRGNAAATRSGK